MVQQLGASESTGPILSQILNGSLASHGLGPIGFPVVLEGETTLEMFSRTYIFTTIKASPNLPTIGARYETFMRVFLFDLTSWSSVAKTAMEMAFSMNARLTLIRMACQMIVMVTRTTTAFQMSATLHLQEWSQNLSRRLFSGLLPTVATIISTHL